MSRRKHWSEQLFCRCGATFRTPLAEAKHRHNFPLFCKKAKLKQKPWWETAKALTIEDARALCRKLATGQCAAICLQHSSLHTTDGKCPEVETVWMKRNEKLVGP